MDGKELAVVRAVISGIYATQHACALREAERGLPKGRLCDNCLDDIQAAMERIVKAVKRLK